MKHSLIVHILAAILIVTLTTNMSFAQQQTAKTTQKGEKEKTQQAQPAKKESKNNQQQILQQIEALQPKPDSIPKLMGLLEQQPDIPTLEKAIAFLLRMDPAAPHVIRAFIKLAYHPKPEIRERSRQEILKRGPDFFVFLRHLLKEGKLEQKSQVADLLSQRGAIEVPTFLELLQSENPKDRDLAQKHLVEIGPPVIPQLAELAETLAEPELKKLAIQIFYEIGNVEAIILAASEKRGVNAHELFVEALARLGKNSINPIIQVLRINSSQDVRKIVEESFARIGPQVIPKLLPLSYDPNAAVRKGVEYTIKSFGHSAVPYLITILQISASLAQKKFALMALANIGPQAQKAITVIKPMLTKKGELQYPAIYAVQKIGKVAKDVIPELKQAFSESQDWMVRAAAANALANADKAAASALPSLIRRLQREEYGEVRLAICRAIAAMGIKGKAAVPQLVLTLEDLDETVVQAAAEALGNIGPEARTAIPNLILALSSFGSGVRQSAARALAKIGRASIPKLIYTLRFVEDAGARQGAAMALKFMGPKASSAISSLILALRTDYVDIVRSEAALALGEIGPVSIRSILSLIEASQNDSMLVREAVAKALAKLGKIVIPRILMTLRRYDDDERVRVTLVRALGNLGPDAAETIDILVSYLHRWQGIGQKEVVIALGKMGPAAKQTIPVLADILKNNRDESLHRLITDTLVKFGNDSIPAVLPLLKNNDKLPRQSAMYVLEKLNSAAISYLLEIVRTSKDEFLVAQALKILGKNSKYLDELLKLLRHDSEMVRQEVSNAVIRVGVPAIPKLLKIINKSNDIEECNRVRSILSRLGIAAVTPLLKALKQIDRPLSKKVIIATIGDIGPKATIAADQLVELMVQWKGEERLIVARCFGKIGESTIPYLVKLLRHKDKDVQEAAIIAMGETQSPKAIVYLLNTLSDPSWLPRVITAIVKMKKLAVPVLVSSLNDANQYVRFACAAALFQIGNDKVAQHLQQQYHKETHPMVKYMLEMAINNANKKP